MNTFDFICAYEAGETTHEETLAGFAELIRTGLAWQLQGCYGRAAVGLIESGLITRDGAVVNNPEAVR